MHDELFRFDNVDVAVGTDADLLALDERGGRRLELDLFAFDAVGGQLPADAEKATGGLHTDLLRLNRRNLRCPAQIDRDFLGLQPAVDTNGSARSKFLGFDGAINLERAARLDLFGLQGPRDSRGARRAEFLHMHVGLEDAGPGDARGLGLQGTLDPRTPRGLELDRLDRVPAHDTAAENLDRLLAQLRSDSREIDRTHRFADGMSGVLCMAARLGGCLRDHGADRLAEVRHRRLGRFRLLRLRIVAGFDLQVRLLVDLAPREPFLKLSEDVLPLHWLHRKVEATAKYISFRAMASIGFLVIHVWDFWRARVDFAASSCAWERSTVSCSPVFLCPNMQSRWDPVYLCKPRG